MSQLKLATKWLKRITTHPLTIVSAGIGISAHTTTLPVVGAIAATAWHNAGALFAATTVVGSQLAPKIPWLPEGWFTVAIILSGILFVATKATKIVGALSNRLNGNGGKKP